MSRKLIALSLAATVLAAAPAFAQSAPVTVSLANTLSEPVGTVTLTEGAAGLLVQGNLTGLPPGPHGISFHGVGLCEAPPRSRPEDPAPFASAGPIFNPTGVEHGYLTPTGPRLGDLPNIYVAADGTVMFDFFVPGLTLATLQDADGSAITVKTGDDDYVTQSSGGAGDRIACATIL